MLAAAWRLAGAMLMDVKQIARDNTALKAALRRDDKFRKSADVQSESVQVK